MGVAEFSRRFQTSTRTGFGEVTRDCNLTSTCQKWKNSALGEQEVMSLFKLSLVYRIVDMEGSTGREDASWEFCTTVRQTDVYVCVRRQKRRSPAPQMAFDQ